jgi:uncharacterized protein (DUF433 family)
MIDRIIIDPGICHGKPIIAGTRTPVEVILDSLAAGDSMALLCKEYDLTERDILACIAFASQEIKAQRYHRIPA